MKDVKARAVFGADKKFEKTTIERREVGPKDILIEIKYAGICHSDIHTARGEWGEKEYPRVPGHEIVGVVADVGSEVTEYEAGDSVGVGCMVNSCGECEYCRMGEEQHCANGNVGTYAGVDKYGDGERTQGGYSRHIVVTEKLVRGNPGDGEWARDHHRAGPGQPGRATGGPGTGPPK